MNTEEKDKMLHSWLHDGWLLGMLQDEVDANKVPIPLPLPALPAPLDVGSAEGKL